MKHLLFVLVASIMLVGCGNDNKAPTSMSPSEPTPTRSTPPTSTTDPSTQQPVSESPLKLDAAKCAVERRSYNGGQGSSFLQVTGKQSGKCVILYGYEIENPKWDGKPSLRCEVPPKTYEFTAEGYAGLSIESIQQYCKSLN